jgi:hypothetical protein
MLERRGQRVKAELKAAARQNTRVAKEPGEKT